MLLMRERVSETIFNLHLARHPDRIRTVMCARRTVDKHIARMNTNVNKKPPLIRTYESNSSINSEAIDESMFVIGGKSGQHTHKHTRALAVGVIH